MSNSEGVPHCCYRSYRDWRNFRGKRCPRKATIVHDGKHYCWQHDPKATAERRVKIEHQLEEKFEASRKAQRLADHAPALLEALERLVAQADRHSSVGVWWDEARTAIAKAKGTQKP